VKSPNPENAEALAMAVERAERTGAELVIGTDPDADRMGVVVRDGQGKMRLLTGNQIGSLMAWYRAKAAFELGWLGEGQGDRAVIIKTYVTTDLQRAIADHFGIPVVDTLTGFKYIAGKLRRYEQALPAADQARYRELDEATTRALRLRHSRFFLFGGEESYGYLGCDFVRDKDANGAAVMFAEVAAYAKAHGTTVADLLDDLHRQFGYHEERGQSLVMEGADGAVRIQNLARSYSDSPPREVDGVAVSEIRDFSREDILDAEGELLPKEKMLFVDLADGRRFAVRPSGTEPKIKFYLFGRAEPGPDLERARQQVGASLDALWAWIGKDATERMA
jgi:phosphoglucomutase